MSYAKNYFLQNLNSIFQYMNYIFKKSSTKKPPTIVEH